MEELGGKTSGVQNRYSQIKIPLSTALLVGNVGLGLALLHEYQRVRVVSELIDANERADREVREDVLSSLTPCDLYDQNAINQVRKYIARNTPGLFLALKDADLGIANQDAEDVLFAAVEAQTFCDPNEVYRFGFSDSESFKIRTVAEKIHPWSVDRPGVFSIKPPFFNFSFCRQVSVFVHEGIHMAVGADHDPRDNGNDWIYKGGVTAEKYCLDHPPVQE